MDGRRSLSFKLTVAFLALVAVLFAAHSVWLPWIGSALVRDDGPAKADIAVVLAGDYRGNRIEKAAELVRQGYVPAVLVSGPEGFYGQHESDLAIRYAVLHGYPAEWFMPLPNEERNTRGEARAVVAELRRRRVHTFVVVTSNYHTARAARIYRSAEREAGGGLQFRMVAAPDPDFRPDSWWHSREGLKTVFMESCKTIAGALGI